MDAAVSAGQAIFTKIHECKVALEEMGERADNMEKTLTNVSELLKKREQQPEFRDGPIQKNIDKQVNELAKDLKVIQHQRKSRAWVARNFLCSCFGSGHAAQAEILRIHRERLTELISEGDSEVRIVQAGHLSDMAGGAARKKIRHPGVSEFWISSFKNEFSVPYREFENALVARYKGELEAMFPKAMSSVLRLLRSHLDISGDDRVSVNEVDDFFCPAGASEDWNLIDVIKYHLTDTRLLLPALTLGSFCRISLIACHKRLAAIACKRHVKVLDLNELNQGFSDVVTIAIPDSVTLLRFFEEEGEMLLLIAFEGVAMMRMYYAWTGQLYATLDAIEPAAEDIDYRHKTFAITYFSSPRVRVLKQQQKGNTWATSMMLVVNPSAQSVRILEGKPSTELVVRSFLGGISVWDVNTGRCSRVLKNSQFCISISLQHETHDVVGHFANEFRYFENVHLDTTESRTLPPHAKGVISIQKGIITTVDTVEGTLTMTDIKTGSVRILAFPSWAIVQKVFNSDKGCLVCASSGGSSYLLRFTMARTTPEILTSRVFWGGSESLAPLAEFSWISHRHVLTLLEKTEPGLYLSVLRDHRIQIWRGYGKIIHSQNLALSSLPFQESICDCVVRGELVYLQTTDGYLIEYNFAPPYTADEIQAVVDKEFRKLMTISTEVKSFVQIFRNHIFRNMKPQNARKLLVKVQHMSRSSRLRIRKKLGTYAHLMEYREADVVQVMELLETLTAEISEDIIRQRMDAKNSKIPEVSVDTKDERFLLPTRWANPKRNTWLFAGEKLCSICQELLEPKEFILGKHLRCVESVSNCDVCNLPLANKYAMCDEHYDIQKNKFRLLPCHMAVLGSVGLLGVIPRHTSNTYGPVGNLVKVNVDTMSIIDTVEGLYVASYSNVRGCKAFEGFFITTVGFNTVALFTAHPTTPLRHSRLGQITHVGMATCIDIAYDESIPDVVTVFTAGLNSDILIHRLYSDFTSVTVQKIQLENSCTCLCVVRGSLYVGNRGGLISAFAKQDEKFTELWCSQAHQARVTTMVGHPSLGLLTAADDGIIAQFPYHLLGHNGQTANASVSPSSLTTIQFMIHALNNLRVDASWSWRASGTSDFGPLSKAGTVKALLLLLRDAKAIEVRNSTRSVQGKITKDFRFEQHFEVTSPRALREATSSEVSLVVYVPSLPHRVPRNDSTTDLTTAPDNTHFHEVLYPLREGESFYVHFPPELLRGEGKKTMVLRTPLFDPGTRVSLRWEGEPPTQHIAITGSETLFDLGDGPREAAIDITVKSGALSLWVEPLIGEQGVMNRGPAMIIQVGKEKALQYATSLAGITSEKNEGEEKEGE